MKPINVNKSNEKCIKNNFYTYDKTNKIPKFKINDIVRISLKRRQLFDKPSGNTKWSEELFKIHSIHKSNVITYKIKDMNNEIIKGILYEKELQKTRNTSDEYIIEKILKTNKNKIYVKWRGYSNNFNSRIHKNSVTKYIYKNDTIYKNECHSFFSILSIKMTQFINFNDTLHKFLIIKTI